MGRNFRESTNISVSAICSGLHTRARMSSQDDESDALQEHAHETELAILRNAYLCRNANCRRTYKLMTNLSTLNCSYHPGTIMSDGTYSCCHRISVEDGCTACDHWCMNTPPVGKPFELPLSLYRYLADRTHVKFNPSLVAIDETRGIAMISRSF